MVRGVGSPDFPLRVLNLFAQRMLRFDRVAIAHEGDGYALVIEHYGLTAEQAEILLYKMRAMVPVDCAELHALD